MRGRETRRAPSADLLACFPSRTHLPLMPKPTSNLARPSKPHQNRHHHHHWKKFSSGGGRSRASPLLWTKIKQIGLLEPSEPKETCGRHIKVRHRASYCKNWQSLIEEIHSSKKCAKKSNPAVIFDVLVPFQLNQISLAMMKKNMKSIGNIKKTMLVVRENSRAIFSKWLMMLPLKALLDSSKKTLDSKRSLSIMSSI